MCFRKFGVYLQKISCTWQFESQFSLALVCTFFEQKFKIKEKIRSILSIKNQVVSPLDALWSLFKSQPKAVRNAFTQRLLQEEVDAEAMRERLVVKESLTQAFKEFREAEEAGVELPDARNLFK